MICAYDIDGVLAEAPPTAAKKWGLMNGAERRARLAQLERHYRKARVLHHPMSSFWAVSARKENTRQITEDWLARHFKMCQGVFLLSGPRTTERVVKFKIAALRQVNAQEFTEDNLRVLRAVARQLTECQCYWFDGKRRIPLCDI